MTNPLSNQELVELKLSAGIALQWGTEEEMNSFANIPTIDSRIHQSWVEDRRNRFLRTGDSMYENERAMVIEWNFRFDQLHFTHHQYDQREYRLGQLIGFTKFIMTDGYSPNVQKFVSWALNHMNSILYMEHYR